MPLFHGSPAHLRPGDVVRPGARGLAYATPDEATARAFARRGRVYEVEPLDPDGCWAAPVRGTGGEPHREVVSRVGFRVVARLRGPATGRRSPA